ncbi:MAG TPA: amidohydrolase family protein [Acidimicrobiales bacterium]|jgi:predicted TIM-barrel fold metal-dependent hydrolase
MVDTEGPRPAAMMVDADAHVTEPTDLWEREAPPGRRNDVPHYETDEEGRVAMWIGPDRVSAARKVDESAYYAGEVPTIVNDVGLRLSYMNQTGFWAQVCYPNVGGTVLGRLLSIKDAPILDFCVRTYNDWLADWARPSGGRLVPVAMLPLQDVAASVRELTRAVDLGHRAVLLPHRPEEMGLPLLVDRAWDPLWQACQDADVPITFHGGFGDDLNRKRLYNPDWRGLGYAGAASMGSIVAFMDNAEVLLLLMFSGIFQRFPGLRVASAESGIGYIPYLLEAADWHYAATRMREERPEFDRPPSEYFKGRVYTTYWFERSGPARLLDEIGVDTVMFETDFPHRTSLYGQSQTTGRPLQEIIADGVESLRPEDRSKVLWENAARLFRIAVPAGQPA